MTSRRITVFISLLGFLAPLFGCGETPEVPDDAKLLYYGHVTDADEITTILPLEDNDGSRQVYVYDDTTSKLVAVRTVDPKHRDLKFQWVSSHKYRVYFY